MVPETPGPESVPAVPPELLPVVPLVAGWLGAVEVDPVLVAGDTANTNEEASKQEMSKKKRDLGTLR